MIIINFGQNIIMHHKINHCNYPQIYSGLRYMVQKNHNNHDHIQRWSVCNHAILKVIITIIVRIYSSVKPKFLVGSILIQHLMLMNNDRNAHNKNNNQACNLMSRI